MSFWEVDFNNHAATYRAVKEENWMLKGENSLKPKVLLMPHHYFSFKTPTQTLLVFFEIKHIKNLKHFVALPL